jgi:Flp pilus assembly protein TadD
MSATDHPICPPELLSEAAARADADTTAGLSAVEDLLHSYPADPRLHFLKGSLLAALSRFDEALAPFTQAVRLNPQFPIARFQLGLLQLTSGDAAAAAATWAPLEALDPEQPLRLFAEGLLRLAADEFALAEALLRRGVAANAELPPLNRDMQVVLDAMSARAAADDPEATSSAHLLLQFSGKGTRH